MFTGFSPRNLSFPFYFWVILVWYAIEFGGVEAKCKAFGWRFYVNIEKFEFICSVICEEEFFKYNCELYTNGELKQEL